LINRADLGSYGCICYMQYMKFGRFS